MGVLPLPELYYILFNRFVTSISMNLPKPATSKAFGKPLKIVSKTS